MKIKVSLTLTFLKSIIKIVFTNTILFSFDITDNIFFNVINCLMEYNNLTKHKKKRFKNLV